MFDLNGVAKFLLSQFVHDNGSKVVLTSECSDEHFADYSFHMADCRRKPDTSLNYNVDGREEKLKAIETSGSMWDDIAHYPMSYTDAVVSRRILIGISSHRLISTTFGLLSQMFIDAVMKRTGSHDPCFALACINDGVGRYKAKTR